VKDSLWLLGIYLYSKTEEKLVASYLYDWCSISKPRISYTKKLYLQFIILPTQEDKDYGICVYCHSYLVTGITALT